MKACTSIGLGMYLVAFGGCAEVQSDYGNTAHVRVAHLSPDAPAVDFCLAPAGTDRFTGPVLGGAGGLVGIAYGKVTRYFEVAPLAYDVRLVAPGSVDCAKGLVPDFTDLPALPADGAVTIAAIGKLEHGTDVPAFELRAYVDRLEVDPDQASLRFIHASPGTPNVDVGLGGGALFQPVFADVAYGGLLAHDDGYVTTAPLAGVELSARATGSTSDVLAIKPASLERGTIATAFAIGELGSATTPLRVLLCADSAPPHALETECALVGDEPERAHVRIAHLSPDAPAVDLCITTTGGAFDQAPFLHAIGLRAGLAYPQVTEYVELPIATYDVRVIAATEATCANPAVPDIRGVAVGPGFATVAAIGALDRSGPAIGDPGFQLAVYADTLEVATGKGKLRFIHASPGTPNVDVGLGSGHGFIRLFGNVEFGKIAVHGGIDALGYLEANPFTSSVSARVTGGASDALIIPSVTLDAGDIATAFAIGNKSGSAAPPLRVLLCRDSARTQALLAQCIVAP
jgi:hypothetical protein